MASEVTLIAVPGKMHIYAWVIEVACINSEVKFVLKGLRGCFGLNGLRGHLNDHLKQPTIDTTEAVKHYMISYFLLPLVATKQDLNVDPPCHKLTSAKQGDGQGKN